MGKGHKTYLFYPKIFLNQQISLTYGVLGVVEGSQIQGTGEVRGNPNTVHDLGSTSIIVA